MSVITLRGLNSNVEKKVRLQAGIEKKSINRFLVDLIEGNVLGRGKGKAKVHNDLDDLIGTMSKKDADVIDKNSAAQRQIDTALLFQRTISGLPHAHWNMA